jgi:hypothetical protein
MIAHKVVPALFTKMISVRSFLEERTLENRQNNFFQGHARQCQDPFLLSSHMYRLNVSRLTVNLVRSQR